MGENLYSAFPKDFYGNDTATLPVLQGVDSLREIDFLFDLAAGTTIETWIVFGKEKYKFELGAGCTAVMGPDMYPFLQSKQLIGSARRTQRVRQNMRRWSGKGKCRKRNAPSKRGTRNYYPLCYIWQHRLFYIQKGTACVRILTF